MKYYLKHFFNPDHDHQNAKPGGGLGTDENADVYSMGYAQNVIPGQLLAQIVPLDQVAGTPDPRFIRNSPALPQGANTVVHPDHPDYLIADSRGYVFYNEGKITVKGLLNVRQNVDFRTGNIFFVGDMAVHGSVRSGFSAQANNLRVKGMVEGGIVRARRDLMVDGGARGGSGQHCLLDAGGKLLSPFLEKVEARARGNMAIEKYCLYSTVYAGANMIVRGQMYGSVV
ncbi:MAG: FapA family protein, partial [Desulfovibrio sp.]|nr:FapA family protein [Desulfovibrio sp.]